MSHEVCRPTSQHGRDHSDTRGGAKDGRVEVRAAGVACSSHRQLGEVAEEGRGGEEARDESNWKADMRVSSDSTDGAAAMEMAAEVEAAAAADASSNRGARDDAGEESGVVLMRLVLVRDWGRPHHDGRGGTEGGRAAVRGEMPSEEARTNGASVAVLEEGADSAVACWWGCCCGRNGIALSEAPSSSPAAKVLRNENPCAGGSTGDRMFEAGKANAPTLAAL